MTSEVDQSAERVLSQPLLRDISEVVGSTFLVADPERLIRNIAEFERHLSVYYSNTRFGYSFKTNYLPAFIEAAMKHGCFAEVVSGMEYRYARLLGIPASQIMFNGPVKSIEDMVLAAHEGAVVVFDSVSEVDQGVAAFEGNGLSQVPVALRCSLTDITPGTRFGMDLTSPQGEAAIRRILASGTCRLVGLHAHHSGDRRPERFRARAESLLRLLELPILRTVQFDWIDVGGGFSSPMPAELANQMAFGAPTYEQYAEAVAAPFFARWGDRGPRLLLEPGMGVLADAMTLVTRVVRKKSQSDCDLLVVDANVFNVQPLRGAIELPVRRATDGTRPMPSGTRPQKIVGSTCMEVDVVRHASPIAFEEGDFVIISHVGAYSNVLNAPFIRGLPAIVQLNGTQGWQVLRQPSGASQLAASYGIDS